MKTFCFSKTIIALTVAVAATTGHFSLANAQTMPPPVSDNALPANIPPGSALADVVKLVQSGVDAAIIKNYIANSASTFNLDAETIITLTDLGVPADIVNAMMEHDKNFSVAPVAPAPASYQNNSSDNSPPTAPVTVEYFNNTLTPYGSWVEVEGYGRCWRPTTVIYDSTWQPYCDRGHWVYTDCGWYWDSDYSWGATFHYGRWFRHDRFGWCWYPDTVWAPSWVTWRQSDAYCGWAPLPPFAIYRPGFGFSYRGASVAVGFDFGLPARCFTFVPAGNFYDRHPRYHRAEEEHREEIFHRTTVINNFNDDRRTIFNGGISVDRVRGATHRPIQPVVVSELPNARRQGWRGENPDRPDRRPGNQPFDNRTGGNAVGTPLRPGPGLRDDHNNDANASRRQGIGQPNPSPNRNENINSPARPQSPEPPGNRNGQRERDFNNRNSNPSVSSPQNLTPPANNQPAPGTPFVRNQPQRITPPVAGGTPEPAQPQNNRPPGGNDRVQSGNNFRQQQPQFNQAPVNNVPERSAPPPRSIPQIEQRQFTLPSAPSAPDRPPQREQRIEPRQNAVITPPPPRSIPQVEQRQFTLPSAPSAPDRPPQREQRIEPRQNAVITPPPPQNPAPAQSQPSRNSDRSSDRDRQNR